MDRQGNGGKIKIFKAVSGYEEANFVVTEINQLKAHFGLVYSDFAVLYRTNAQSRVIEEALLHAGIPYTLVGGVRFYDRKEIKDILSFIKLSANSKDSVSQKRIEKIGKKIYEKFKNHAGKINIERTPTLDLMDDILFETKYLDRFKNNVEEDLARLENIKELRSVASQFPNVYEFLENVALIEAEQLDSGKIHTLRFRLSRKKQKSHSHDYSCLKRIGVSDRFHYRNGGRTVSPLKISF
jgi:DNA helicase II / ATP-dependent DNA helicase PcrA